MRVSFKVNMCLLNNMFEEYVCFTTKPVKYIVYNVLNALLVIAYFITPPMTKCIRDEPTILELGIVFF